MAIKMKFEENLIGHSEIIKDIRGGNQNKGGRTEIETETNLEKLDFK